MKKKVTIPLILIIIFFNLTYSQYLDLPPRPKGAPPGTAFAQSLKALDLAQRDSLIAREILSGNIPAFLRELIPIHLSQEINGKNYDITYYVSSDYLVIGSNKDYWYNPISPDVV